MSKLMPSCPANCTLCGPQKPDSQGPAEWQAAQAQAAGSTDLAGWSLLWRMAGALLGPVAAGLIGMILAGEGEGRRLVGLTAGLGLGMVAAILAARLGGYRRRQVKAKESA